MKRNILCTQRKFHCINIIFFSLQKGVHTKACGRIFFSFSFFVSSPLLRINRVQKNFFFVNYEEWCVRQKLKYGVYFFFVYMIYRRGWEDRRGPLPLVLPAAASWIINNGNHDNCRIIDDFNQVSLSGRLSFSQIYGFCLHFFPQPIGMTIAFSQAIQCVRVQ